MRIAGSYVLKIEGKTIDQKIKKKLGFLKLNLNFPIDLEKIIEKIVAYVLFFSANLILIRY